MFRLRKVEVIETKGNSMLLKGKGDESQIEKKKTHIYARLVPVTMKRKD